MKKTLLLCSAGIIGMTFSGTAFAQADGADADADTSDIIIVTATLREADVQDVPLAVTAINPAELERQGVTDIRTIDQVSASFNMNSTQTESQGSTLRIRGVGTTGNNIGLESAVGVFIDGVYQSRPGVALGDMVDLERLEVLRGPQGTLFGRNVTAGALNITTRRPSTRDFEGFVNATYGNLDFFNLQAGVNVPVAQDTLGFRVSGAYRRRDGILDSTTGAESGNRDRWLVRGQLLWEPTPDISLRIIADYSEANEQCCDAVVLRDSELAAFYPLTGLPAGGGITTTLGLPALDNRLSNGEQFDNPFEQWGVSAQLDWDLGGAQLTYIGSYRDFRAESVQESDFVSVSVFSAGQGTTAAPGATPTFDDIETMSHELRLQGTAFDGAWDWLIGAYYSDESIVEDATLTLGRDYQQYVSAFFLPTIGLLLGPNPVNALTAFGNGGIPVDANGDFARNLYTQDSESISIFTHNVFHLTDEFSITLGARYVDETKDGAFTQLAANSPACNAIARAVAGGLFPAALAPLGPTALAVSCFPFATEANRVEGGLDLATVLPLPNQFAGTFEDDELIYTIQAAYEPNPDILLYAGFTHGYKAGGFNLDSTAAVLGGDPRFASEEVDAYEVGAKFEFANRRVRLNLSGFHMEMSNFQVLEFTGIQFVTFNVPNVLATGFEAEGFAQVTDNFSVSAALTYSNARYPSDCNNNLPAPAQVANLCGADLTNSPDLVGIFGATFDGPITASGWSLLANANVRMESQRRTSTQPSELGAANTAPLPFDIQEDNVKVNLRLGLTTPDERFTFEIWGTNIFDVVTRNVTFNVPLRGTTNVRARAAFIQEPARYGVTARARF